MSAAGRMQEGADCPACGEREAMGFEEVRGDMQIRSTARSEFITFKGVPHNKKSIKLTEGVDIFWVQDPQTTGARSKDEVSGSERVEKPPACMQCGHKEGEE